MSNQITMKNLITEAFNDKQLAFFEQGMNTLLADEDGRIKTIRTACSEAVKDKLKERLHKKYNSLIEELHEKYSDKIPDRKELEQIFIARFGLSKDNSKKLAKQFIFNLCAPTDNAFLNAEEAVYNALIKNEISEFGKTIVQKKIASLSTWSRFINAKNASDKFVERLADEFIAENLADESWKTELVKKNISQVFDMNEAIRKETNERMNPIADMYEVKTFDDIDYFGQNIVGINRDTLKRFNLDIFKTERSLSGKRFEQNNSMTEKEKDKIKVEFYELLKLIVFFGMEETEEKKEASEYLAKAGRGFVTNQDLAFLTAITKGYETEKFKKPVYAALIVYFLSEDPDIKIDTDPPKINFPYKYDYIYNIAAEEGLIDSILKKRKFSKQNEIQHTTRR